MCGVDAGYGRNGAFESSLINERVCYFVNAISRYRDGWSLASFNDESMM